MTKLLKDICLNITDGKHGDCQNEDESGYYFISCKDVREGIINYANARQITETDYYDVHKRTKLEPNDILITNSGTIGRMVLVKDQPRTYRTTFQKSVAIIKPDKDQIIPKWLYYSLNGNVATLISRAGGTAQKNLLLRDLRSFNINIPPFSTQHKIASILSAYDNLIENNLRRIKILEEMAQNLYREWFVKFRFPSHEKVKFVDSPLGEIPEGWEVRIVKDVVKRGKPGKLYNQKTASPEGLVPILDQGRSGIIGYHNDAPSVSPTENEPVIVFANHTCYQKIIQYPFSAIQNVLPFVSSDQYTRSIYWLHWVTKDLVVFNDYKGHWPEFMSKELIVPDFSLTEEFSTNVEPIVRLIFRLDKINNNLRQTRDILLPRLISGELDVSDLDIKVPKDTA